jgi:hypothetical protein
MSSDQQVIGEVVARAPEWLRRDLMSDDRGARTAAEEALAAMIANALANIDRK